MKVMNGAYILAVDIGTSSVRAMVLDRFGESKSEYKIQYGVLNPQPQFEEQDPDEISDTVFKCIRGCLDQCGDDKAQIKGMSFSSQMYCILALDAEGKPLCNSILWSDCRSKSDAELLKKTYGNTLYEITGCPVSSIYPISKIAWMRRVRPDIYENAAEYISIKEYVMRRIVDEKIVDYSMASATGLFDIHKHEWSSKAMDAVGLGVNQLSQPVSGRRAFKVDKTYLLAEWGVSSEFVLYPGGGDGPLANIGAGAGGIGEMNIDLGTSGAARVVCDRPVVSPGGELWCFCLTDSIWTCGGILANVGNALVWLHENLLTDEPGAVEKRILKSACSTLEELTERVAESSEGLFFLPYMRGARTPYWDPDLSGTMFGLKANHDSRHVVRALIEAIGYDLFSILGLMEDMGETIGKIVLSGGLCRGNQIPQILADVLGREVSIGRNTEASLRGAAILGLSGMGELKTLSFEEKDSQNSALHTLRPDSEKSDRYRELHNIYVKLLELLIQRIKPILGGIE